ncbi:uncharacterized protein FOMMEDRAFT_26221 [Fomitiporia mediterranea MF3/22]|uniref:uncharacterized protein n=1 Tax=Fomitiporia mediterranea (strain MF3/22) TaxID=694068 RepID=UPI0004409231|nr:uncharacterized protein FOMMEDRAFT_26221 [Fomitiporia mediterranea MF3/22]EJD07124.1 hypothetical protein FOMMEDRAFT_26221 [Fomitiporia mediterranea MF3/22]
MASGGNEEIVIKRKRRRTAAVDPCLGYHGHRVAHDAIATPSFSITTNVNYGGNDDDVDAREEYTKKTDLKETSTASSDSVPAITSPFSEEAEFITVEDFLRRQEIPSTRRTRKTYSRKRRRVIQSSSENEEERCNLTSKCVGANLGAVGNNPSPTTSHKRSKTNMSITDRNSKKPSRKQQRVHTSFSKRIQRAAVLSGADLEFNSPPTTPLALRLVPHDVWYSPRSPPRDKRAKFVDPRIPRPLDTSFANKENTPYETRPRLPLSQWCSPFKQMKDVPHSVLPKGAEANASLPQTPRSTLTPLQLVSYAEHNQTRSAKFYQYVSFSVICQFRSEAIFFRILSMSGRPVIAPLVLEAHCDLPSLTMTRLGNDKDDPFVSLPLDEGSQTRAPPTQIHQASMQQNEDDNSRSVLHVLSSDDLEILVPATSPSPSHAPPTQDSARPGEKNDENNDPLQPLELNCASNSSNAQAPAPSAKVLHTITGSDSVAASQPRRPLRRIGTMLEGFMETARSVLLSQSQPQMPQACSRSRDPSIDHDLLERNMSVKKSKIDRTMSRSGRVVVSSPARLTNISKAQYQGTSPALHRSTATSRRKKRNRKATSMPSVSAYLGHTIKRSQLETEDQPSVSSSTNPQQHNVYSPLQDPTHTIFPVVVEDRDRPSFFDDYDVPDLSDLLEDAEPRSHAQIMLSPTV